MHQNRQRLHIGLKQTLSMIAPYVGGRLRAQVRAVSLIVLYMVLFQLLVLGVPIAGAAVITGGIIIVTVGLAFFLEGLLIGIMPLGELCGVRLPEKTTLVPILLFSFILGVGATLAEPAIGFLKGAGETVTAWQAPLLFALLTRYSNLLVAAIGAGVGLAVALAMARFLYNWSIKPILYIIVPTLLLLTGAAWFDADLRHVAGLAWDSGAITTGPVTVPLVLALGIGISRITGRADRQLSGLGVVALASALPILTVLVLGFALRPLVPAPMTRSAFLASAQRPEVAALFPSRSWERAYVLSKLGPRESLPLFNGEESALISFVAKMAHDRTLTYGVFGSESSFANWLATSLTAAERSALRGEVGMHASGTPSANAIDLSTTLVRNLGGSLKAILPLCLLLFLTLAVFLRERIERWDEIFFGVIIALFGMFLFNIGMELGLARLGSQTGGILPASFTEIQLGSEQRVIQNFDPSVVQTAIDSNGQKSQFFYLGRGTTFQALPFVPHDFDPQTRDYVFHPLKGPLFGHGLDGFLVVLLFAFMMGYGATVAEPSLSALGITLEEITVGIFKRKLLIRTVAVGVGTGMAFGFAMVIWHIPLLWLLAPSYALLLVMTVLSTEEFVTIAWDSAGVTTGPVTVPLVLSTGLAVSQKVGAVDGFGILALASVFPAITVLAVGLFITRRQFRLLKYAEE